MAIWLYRTTQQGARAEFLSADPSGLVLGEYPIRRHASKAQIGDTVVICIVSGDGPLQQSGQIMALGVVIDATLRSSSSASGNSEIVVDLKVDVSKDLILEVDVIDDYTTADELDVYASRRHWSTISESRWARLLDRLPLSTLTEIERSIMPGALSTAGRSSTRYQATGRNALKEVLDKKFNESRNEDNTGTRFKALALGGWRQFIDVNIEFHDRLTVLTGANGAGKTSILNLLSPHFNWTNAFVATPRQRRDDHASIAPATAASVRLRYTNGVEAAMQAPPDGSPSYTITWQNQQQVSGLFIPSHRSISGYSEVPQMPTSFSTGSVLLEQFLNEVRSRYAGGYSGKSAGQWMKESLLAAAFHGAGGTSEFVQIDPNPDAREVWQGFQVVLRRLLPESMRFRGLAVQSPEVVIVTDRGSFPLDAVSGGMRALIELGWQIFLRSKEQSAFTVVFDEPENHLHPELQRSILPRLLESFPGVTFVVATHSPFIVTSVPGAFVYALDYTDAGVVSYRLDPARGAKSAGEVLRRVLGVNSTLPLWADAALEGILDQYRNKTLTPELFRQLRSQLDEVGLLDEFPATAAALAELDDDA